LQLLTWNVLRVCRTQDVSILNRCYRQTKGLTGNKNRTAVLQSEDFA